METRPHFSNQNLIEITKIIWLFNGRQLSSCVRWCRFSDGPLLLLGSWGQYPKEVIFLDAQKLNWLWLFTALLFWNKWMKLGWRNIQGNYYSSRGGCRSGVPEFLTLLVSWKAKPEAWPGAGCGAGWGCRAAVRQECPCVSGKPQGVVRSQSWPGSCEDNESVVGIKWYCRAPANLGFVWRGLFGLKYKGQGLVFLFIFYCQLCHQLV